jgi:hypothetical protein
MIGYSVRRLVNVEGEDCWLEVYQQSKSVFLAGGSFRDKSFEGKGRSEGSAISDWISRAKYSLDPQR